MLKEEFINQFVSNHSVIYIGDIRSGVIEEEIIEGTYLIRNAEVKE